MADLARLARRLGGALLIAMAAVACSPNTAVRGSLPQEEQISLIRPGVHGREDVRSILGSPSVTGTFDKDVWYYIGRRTEQYAFFERDVIDQQVIIVRFGDDGLVDKVSRLDKSDGREVALVERETPSAGRELGVFEQIFGNVGRFNSNEPASP